MIDLRRADYRVPMGAHVRADTLHDGDNACVTCRAERGPYTSCRTFSGAFYGACTNCAHGGHSERCTFYTGRKYNAAELLSKD